MFGLFQPKVEELARIAGEELPWRQDGLLFVVHRGVGALRWQVEHSHDVEKRSLYLHDRALLRGQCEDCWLPNEPKSWSAGVGREGLDKETLDLFELASADTQSPVHGLIDPLSPLLRLLPSGVYLLSRIPHFPTNGEGQAFWSLSDTPQARQASKNWEFGDKGLYELAQGYPAFLLPTRAPEQCTAERVEHYRSLLRQGHSLGAVALWADGYLSALLDGHHRATAALLEKTPLDCLTILPPTALDTDEKANALALWDLQIPYSTLPKNAIRTLKKQRLVEHSMPPVAPQRAAGEAKIEKTPPFCDASQLAETAASFPTARGLAIRHVAGDCGEKRIAELLAAGESSTPRLWAILQALREFKDPRATPLAFCLARGDWPQLHWDAFVQLATVRSEEVEDFFVNYVVWDEGRNPELRAIADRYLESVEPI